MDGQRDVEESRSRLVASWAFLLTAVLLLGMFIAACAWFNVLPGGGVDNNVFSNISNGLSQ